MQNLETQKLTEIQADRFGRMYRIGLTKAGKELLIKIYPNTSNEEIYKIFGIKKNVLMRFKHELNLHKSEEHIRARDLKCAENGRKKMKEIGYVPKLPKYTSEYLSKRTLRIWRMEKFRVLNGEPQRTKIKLKQPYSKRRTKTRTTLKEKNYIPLTTTNSLSWYYDCSTQRSSQLEESGKKIGFSFHPFR